jgi:class 3 adenylate cyclase
MGRRRHPSDGAPLTPSPPRVDDGLTPDNRPFSGESTSGPGRRAGPLARLGPDEVQQEADIWPRSLYALSVTAQSNRTATVLFTDLVGSTELLSRLGESTFDSLRRAHFAALRTTIEGTGGTEVKTTGDGLLATFSSATDAVGCAVRMQQAVDAHRRTAGIPLSIRVGLSLGDVSFEDGDVFGTPVVEAARLVAAARGGQIVASSLVRLVAGGRCPATFADLGALELKGLPSPVLACEVAWEPNPTPSAPLPALLRRPERIFVGRESEMQRLDRCWREVTAGQLRVVLVAGEPGVGKTRLAAELAARAYAEGATVLAGRCDEDLGVPYQPFVEALHHLVGYATADDLVRRLGRYGGELTRLLPELGDLLPSLPCPLRSDPETERFRLFDAVAAWLAAVSVQEPVLLVLDDLQWAAKPTLLLLRHVLRSSEPMRLLVLATYRDTEVGRSHPLSELLADLRQVESVERVSLQGLDQPAVAAFLEQAAGHELGKEKDELARVIHRETEGNAFFVREVVRHLIETGGLVRHEGRWLISRPISEMGIPDGVRDVVGRRISRLSATANQALSVAAVAGEEFELAVVERASGLDEETLLSALDEAVTARLVAEVAGPLLRSRFAHSLVRATLYEELTGARQAVLHRRVAEAIESLHADRLDDYLPALAHHFARVTAPRAAAAKAVLYAQRAGDRALTQLAHDEAAGYYQQALDLLELGEGPPDDSQRMHVLISLGEAQRRASQPAYRETLFTAAAMAKGQNDPETLVRAVLANNRGVHSRSFAVDHDLVAMLESALAVAKPGDSPTRARLLANLAGELAFSADHKRRLEAATEALAVARRLGDQATLGHVLVQRGALLVTENSAGLREHIAELTVTATRLGDPALAFWAALYGSHTDLALGDAAGHDQKLLEAARCAGELGQPFPRYLVTAQRSVQFRIAGRLEDAENMSREALELGQTFGIPESFRIYRAHLFWILYDQGRLNTLAHRLERAAAREQQDSLTLAAVALAFCELGRPHEARAVFDRIALDDFAVPANFLWLYTMTMAAEACAGLGDAGRAADLSERLAPYHELLVTNLGGATATAAVAHYLGLLATTLGRFDEADVRFAAAAAMHERLSAPALLARTRLEWAHMLMVRLEAGDAERARQLLEHALVTARELGLGTVERRALAHLDPSSGNRAVASGTDAAKS